MATPQQGVQRVPLAFALRVATALGEKLQHGRAVQVGLITKLGCGIDRRVDITVVQLVRGPGIQQTLNHHDDFINRLHRPDVVSRRDDGQRLHVAAEQINLAGAKLAPVHSVAGGALEQRVVYVGDVLDVVHLVSIRQQLAVHQVKREIRRSVP